MKEFNTYTPDDRFEEDVDHLRNLSRHSTYKTHENVVNETIHFVDEPYHELDNKDNIYHEMPDITDHANYVNPDDLHLSIVMSNGAASIMGVLGQSEPVIIDELTDAQRDNVILSQKNILIKSNEGTTDTIIDYYHKKRKSTFAKNAKRK